MLRIMALRDHAAKFRDLARHEMNTAIRERLLSMANECDDMATRIEAILKQSEGNSS